MSDAAHFQPKTASIEALFPAKLLEAQERHAEFVSSANDIVVKTATAIGESQAELLRLETEQATQALVPPKLDKDAGSLLAAYGLNGRPIRKS